MTQKNYPTFSEPERLELAPASPALRFGSHSQGLHSGKTILACLGLVGNISVGRQESLVSARPGRMSAENSFCLSIDNLAYPAYPDL